MTNQTQIVYFSHGGGPLPILGDASHKAMVEFMLQLPSRLRKPDAILVIGSGFSFHNMGAFSWEWVNTSDPENEAFQDWLIEVCAGPISQPEREKLLIDWQAAPSARYCHPREEHLLPLHVCLGMACNPAQTIFDDYILGKRAVAFLW